MPKCWHCNKYGFFLQLSSTGLCMACLEEASDEAVTIIAKLKESREERTRFCKALDKMEIEEMIQTIIPSLEASPFSIWDISIHYEEGQYDRIIRSKPVKIAKYDPNSETAMVEGSRGMIYTTKFDSCTCKDFSTRQLPCKHMYKLASQYGSVDLTYMLK